MRRGERGEVYKGRGRERRAGGAVREFLADGDTHNARGIDMRPARGRHSRTVRSGVGATTRASQLP